MSGRVKHKSRGSERSTGRHKTKKSSKHSSSASDDCVIVIPHRNSCNKDKRRKTEKKKRRRSPSSSSSISNCSIKRLKLVDSSQQLLGERPEFCRNGASYRGNSGVTKFSQGTHKLHSADRTLAGFRSRERTSDKQRQEQYAMYERRVLYKAASEKERSRKRSTNAVEKSGLGSSKSKKSHKRRRSSSSSRSSSPNSRSSSSSSTSSITSSSSSDYERRRKQRKRKKKLARKMKLEKKRRQDEKRKMKKAKEKFKEPVQGIKRSISKTAKDRLLHDINVELADRARAMAPMTKEQWEKKQSVVRRVYDEETGRHRLIKGDGEVLEEIVSRDRHMEINRNATKGDGEFFQSRIRVNK